jgi:hypothetical protein
VNVDLIPAKLVRRQLTPKRILKSLNVVLTIGIIYSIATQMAIILVPLYAGWLHLNDRQIQATPGGYHWKTTL